MIESKPTGGLGCTYIYDGKFNFLVSRYNCYGELIYFYLSQDIEEVLDFCKTIFNHDEEFMISEVDNHLHLRRKWKILGGEVIDFVDWEKGVDGMREERSFVSLIREKLVKN